ncbi:MAG: rRNA maturation RNase YbeY [Spirochaetaceae bacterium]|nr:MAG: rRNA maturation RNase YbeY [Spirochaetaceae bacterium]
MNSVDVTVDDDPDDAPEAAAVARFADTVLQELGIKNWELSLTLCGDRRMKTLNREFRDRDETTDVLSFSQLEGDRPPPVHGTEEEHTVFAGDIVVCLPHARRNAIQFGVDAEEEVKRLIVHGVLHLAGYEHGDNSSEQPMLREQERLVSRLTEERLT